MSVKYFTSDDAEKIDAIFERVMERNVLKKYGEVVDDPELQSIALFFACVFLASITTTAGWLYIQVDTCHPRHGEIPYGSYCWYSPAIVACSYAVVVFSFLFGVRPYSKYQNALGRAAEVVARGGEKISA